MNVAYSSNGSYRRITVKGSELLEGLTQSGISHVAGTLFDPGHGLEGPLPPYPPSLVKEH